MEETLTKSLVTESVQKALKTLQSFTEKEFPVGTKILSRRGRGDATFEVVGYPEPTSIELANSVQGRSKNNKVQILDLNHVKLV